MDYETVKDAYAAGGIVAGDINNILAKGLCADLIAPVIDAYEHERDRGCAPLIAERSSAFSSDSSLSLNITCQR